MCPAAHLSQDYNKSLLSRYLPPTLSLDDNETEHLRYVPLNRSRPRTYIKHLHFQTVLFYDSTVMFPTYASKFHFRPAICVADDEPFLGSTRPPRICGDRPLQTIAIKERCCTLRWWVIMINSYLGR